MFFFSEHSSSGRRQVVEFWGRRGVQLSNVRSLVVCVGSRWRDELNKKIRQVQAKVLADRSSRWCSRHHQNRRPKMIQKWKWNEMTTFKVLFHWASHADTLRGCYYLCKKKNIQKVRFHFLCNKNDLHLRSSLVRFGTCCPKGAQHSKTCRFRLVPRFTVVGTWSIIGVPKFLQIWLLPCVDTFEKVLVKNMLRLWWFLLPNPSRGLRCPREWVVMIAVRFQKLKLWKLKTLSFVIGLLVLSSTLTSKLEIKHKTYWRMDQPSKLFPFK